MAVIKLETIIHADVEVCFDLSRSIDLHRVSTAGTNEKAIAGCTSGLIDLNETVTWEATHFGIRQQLTSIISIYERPFHFRDEQVKGAFKYIIHDHLFEMQNGVVLMKDIFSYAAPFGWMGTIAEKVLLNSYLKKFLITRNNIIKEYAESNKWKTIV
jgi:ligand-binding SRPBCC domain-containing protein